MFKSIFRICIVGALGVFLVALFEPAVVNDITGRITALMHGSNSVASDTNIITPGSFFSYFQKKDPAPTTNQDTTPLSIENIIDATNKERIKAGLLPLKTNTKLLASAKLKTDDMIANHYFEHVSPSGKNVSDLGTQVGYSYILMGENLAVGNFTDATDLLTAWMNSPGHRANILNTNYQEIGVYAAKGVYQGKEVWFAVQHFGTTRNVCPQISQDLKNKVQSMNADLKAREEEINNVKAVLEAPDHPEGQAYKDMVAHFNILVANYNALLSVSQQDIATYNAQVAAFNSCLSVYQKK